MMPFRLARRRNPAAVPGQPATRRARPAASRGRWLTTVAGTCLAAVLVGWPAVLAGQGPSAGTAASGAGPAASVVLTAVREPQARILNPGPSTGLTAIAGNGRVTLSWSPVTAPGAPRGLTATAGIAQVSLSWQAPGSNGGAAITGYRVYQGTSKQPVASVTGTGTTVKNLTNGTGYSFKVTAVNKAGEGPASSAASATPTAQVTK